jgi:hypothetical protein
MLGTRSGSRATVKVADVAAIAPLETTRLSSQTVGNIGLFYVCYQLSRRGWNVMPTSRNARGMDVARGHVKVPTRGHEKSPPLSP